MAITKYTVAEHAQVTETVRTFLKKTGKVLYDQLSKEEKEELRSELDAEVQTKES